jgi:hypothetical protein
MKRTSIAQALQRVANNPDLPDDYAPIEAPVHELVARALFDIANSPDVRVRGSLNRATTAQQILLNRLVGKRRSGSLPVSRQKEGLVFRDLTKGVGQS